MSAVSNVHLNEFGSSSFANQKKDLIDVTCEYLGTKPYGFFKACYALPNFLIQMDYLSGDHQGLNQTMDGAKLAKLSRSPFEFIKYGHSTMTSLSDWLAGKKETRSIDVLRKANDLINPVNEMSDFLSKTLVPIQKGTLETIKGITGASLVFGMGWNTIETLKWISDCKYSELKGTARAEMFTKMTGKMIDLAQQVCYVALGVLSVLSIFFQVFVPQLTMAALSASTVVFTILGFYHQRLGQDKSNN